MVTGRTEYCDWPGLGELYLEDSYVLDVVEAPGQLIFDMEFVLRERHPNYHTPYEGDQYCYQRGWLTFTGVEELRWLERYDARSFDANGQTDLGNIDQLYHQNGRYTACGDWGEVTFVAQGIEVRLQDSGAGEVPSPR